MKDNLSENTGLLTVERNKAKLLTEQSTFKNKINSSQLTSNMDHTSQSVNLTNQIHFNQRNYKSAHLDNDELHILREEVSRLKHQVNKISFHGSSDDVEAIKADLGIVRENKSRLMGEKQKVQEQYKVLLQDKEQFKEDLQEFKKMDK